VIFCLPSIAITQLSPGFKGGEHKSKGKTRLQTKTGMLAPAFRRTDDSFYQIVKKFDVQKL
jgi:hypothetical protein